MTIDYLTSPAPAFPQFRAALRSPLQYLHSLATHEPEIFHPFYGAKTGLQQHAQAEADVNACKAFEVARIDSIEGVECKTQIDGAGTGYILRHVMTHKEWPRGDAPSFANLVQSWHLDLQCAIDLALYGEDVAYEWIVTETLPPHECFIYNPTPALLLSGQEKLKRALANIKAAQSQAKKTGREVLDVTPARQREMDQITQS